MIGAFNAGGAAWLRRRRWWRRLHFGGIGGRSSARWYAQDRAEVVQRQLHAEERHRQPVLRQTPIMNDGSAAKPTTWIENGRLEERLLRSGDGAAAEGVALPGQSELSLVVEGARRPSTRW